MSAINSTRPATAAIVGLGKLGLAVAEGLANRADIEIAAAVDLDPNKLGKDLGELLGREPLGVEVQPSVPEDEPAADIVFLLTGSRLAELAGTIEGFARRGSNVISSAEELGYPWHEFPELSSRLDAAARSAGVSVMGAGVNPGFFMDALPILLSATTQEVVSISIRRTLDLSPHRPARLTRFGLGLTPEEFAALDRETLHGHIGFRQSIDAVADALGWPAEDRTVTDTLPQVAVIATDTRRGDLAEIAPGQVAVVRQSARCSYGDSDLIEIDEYFGFIAEDDPIPPGDGLSVNGSDQSFELAISPCLYSFASTPAILVNLSQPLVASRPGLLTTVDLPVREFGAQRAKRWTQLADAS